MKTLMLCVILIVLGALVLQGVDAGFGCPGDEDECDRHCRSIGCVRGFCEILNLRCTCYTCSHGKKRLVLE